MHTSAAAKNQNWNDVNSLIWFCTQPVWPDWAISIVLGDNFVYKSSLIIGNFLGYFENIPC